MTNASLKAILEKFGRRVDYIILENSRVILIGYPKDDSIRMHSTREMKVPIEISDFQYETFEGEDFFSVPEIDRVQEDIAKYRVWHKTDCIQEIGVMDEDYAERRIHPYRIT